MSTLNDFIYTNKVHDVLAEYVNRLLASTLRSEYKNVETLVGDRQLTDADTPIQRLDCGGANRNVFLPEPDAVENHALLLVNTSDGGEVIILRDYDDTVTLGTIEPGEGLLLLPDGDGGYVSAGGGGGAVASVVAGAGIAVNATDPENPEVAIDPDVLNTINLGWIEDTTTWTYASATSLTKAGDHTAIFRRGVKIRLTQTTLKYFSVISSSYSAPNTTIKITGGGDYTLANAAITDPAFSIAENPQGFPAIFNWSPIFTGFSVDPIGTHRFRVLPSGLYVDVQHETDGTSNTTDFRISAPPGITLPSIGRMTFLTLARDNGAVVATSPGIVRGQTTYYDLSKDLSGNFTGWTNANGKRARFTAMHPIED